GDRGARLASLPADRRNQFFLVHLASAGDVQLLRPIIELIAAPRLQTGPRVSGALRPTVRSPAFFPAILVHRAGGDLLRALCRRAPVLRAVLDVLVLPFVLVAPGFRHRSPPGMDMRSGLWGRSRLQIPRSP